MRKFIVSFLVALALCASVLNTSAQSVPSNINTSTSIGDEGGSPPSLATVVQERSHARLAQAGVGLTGKIFFYVALNGTNSAWPNQQNNALQGISEGGVPVGAAPANFTPLAEGQLVEGWMNTLTANGGGYQIRAGAIISSSSPFKASTIRFAIRSSDPGNTLRFEGTFAGLSVSRVGVGVDGGTYTSGDPWITRVTIAGISSAFVEADTATGEAIRKLIADNRPFSLTASYWIDSQNTITKSVAFNLADSAPPSLSIIKGTGSYYIVITAEVEGIYQIQWADGILRPWLDFQLVNVGPTKSAAVPFVPVANKAIYRAMKVE